MAGRFVPTMDLTQDDEDRNSHVSLQLAASANVALNNAALVTFSRAEGDPRGSRAVLGPQEIVEVVTHRAREALNDPRDTARRALFHQQGSFLAATHQHDAAARQHLVSALARNCEAHNYNMQIQV